MREREELTRWVETVGKEMMHLFIRHFRGGANVPSPELSEEMHFATLSPPLVGSEINPTVEASVE